METVATLLERIDEFAEARARLRRAPDDPADDEHKYALASAVDAWQRLLDARQLVRL
jgi:hypothetical protein